MFSVRLDLEGTLGHMLVIVPRHRRSDRVRLGRDAGRSAQTPTGTILGSVKDAQGAVVPGATVTATNLGTQYSRNRVTDDCRRVRLAAPPGRQLHGRRQHPRLQEFHANRHRPRGRTQRQSRRHDRARRRERNRFRRRRFAARRHCLGISLEDSGQNEVLNLPLVNRDLYSLLSLTGGVTSNENSNSLGGPEQLTTINGSGRAQMGTVNFQLDGGNNTAGLRGTGNPAPNPEAVQEFRVLTNGYSAEYGRYSAGVVDVVTKSGTNVFHGAAFEFFRNEKLNAAALGAAGQTVDEGPARSEPVRRGPWRPDHEGQDVLLRQLLGPAAGGDVLSKHRGGADGARARGRFLAVVAQADATR